MESFNFVAKIIVFIGIPIFTLVDFLFKFKNWVLNFV